MSGKEVSVQFDGKVAWNESYEQGDNLLFSPNEEIIRFFAKYIRKRTGLNQFQDIDTNLENAKILDLGCGIGRHLIYSHDLGLKTYGVDLSSSAINIAKKWAEVSNFEDYKNRIITGDSRSLPWGNEFFRYSISHGVLDSMPFESAKETINELARVMEKGGLFYCDLISGKNLKTLEIQKKVGGGAKGFSGEKIITSKHEYGTIQSYFDMKKILVLFGKHFIIKDCQLVSHTNVKNGEISSRYHLVSIRT